MEPYKVKLGDELIVDTLPNDLERINYIMEHSEADVKNVGVIEVTKFVLLECVDFVAVTVLTRLKSQWSLLLITIITFIGPTGWLGKRPKKMKNGKGR